MRFLLVFLALAAMFVTPLLIFGDRFDLWLTGEGSVEVLSAYAGWAWLIGIGLISADLVLPIPATAVMAALGILYGPWLGGIISTVGALAAGTIAYTACRLIGRRAALFLVGEDDLKRTQAFFNRSGGWAVALSRSLPLLPEVIACLAGLAGMKAGRFFVALLCGSLPMGFAFAWLGWAGAAKPSTAVIVSALLPLLLWPVARKLMNSGAPETGGKAGHAAEPVEPVNNHPSNG